MAFELPPLPYAEDALEPHMSKRTISFHYGKHHKGYVDKLNGLVEGTGFADKPLEDVIRDSARSPEHAGIFNNAAQVWNHTFFWEGMRPDGGGTPEARDAAPLAKLIDQQFGDFAAFKEQFVKASVDRFGSGYSWLILDGDGLAIISTANAETPIVDGAVPLLNCDVWEHAYYLDYQNARPDFVQIFLDKLVDWQSVNQRLADAAPELAKQVA
jgi:Fe-Mn family superoxide dismutase